MPTFVNCTFAKNYAKIGYGGAVFDAGGQGNARNSIFWDNTAIQGGNPVYCSESYPMQITYSDVQGGWSGTGNTNSDPSFVSAGSNNYRITAVSPCIDGGIHVSPGLPVDVGDLDWDSNVSEATPLDLDRMTRVYNGAVDQGAYEIQVN